ncbi:vitamin B12 import ATP-binding protein BtuD [Microbulbifer aestuariivivens]|uniref:Vitamin B12 import ATP-binding protein BtuD n=1 Tax=Microbulbifer aestuariivivens TaxID=1908308 RepID=A0ABP9WJS3_9GAMM
MPKSEDWVLKNVGFDVFPGEAVGFLGQNGAGKSTLLKLIAGTLTATEGSIQVNGRVAAILELGMGFNSDLTGRENVIHTAGLMGFSRSEINAALSEIESFAEIGKHFDQPVRTYSSGMQARVAFAIATAYRPDILIVDEALSVGDTYFQHKSFNRIREFREKGTTLIIVSHDRSTIQSICDRAILLDRGCMIKDGEPEEVFDFYNAIIAEKENSTLMIKRLPSGKVQTKSGTGEAQVTEIVLLGDSGAVTETVAVGEKVELRIKIKIHKQIDELVLGYGIKDRLGQVMYGTNSWHTNQIITNARAGDEYEFKILFNANFGAGSYSVVTALHNRETHLNANYEWRDLALVFSVVNSNEHQFSGCNWLKAEMVVAQNGY